MSDKEDSEVENLTKDESGDEEEVEEYVVEEIIKRRWNAKEKQYEYFLKWIGYPHEENTWEPESNLDCPELIAAFNATQKDKDTKKKPASGKAATKKNTGNTKKDKEVKKKKFIRDSSSEPEVAHDDDDDDDDDDDNDDDTISPKKAKTASNEASTSSAKSKNTSSVTTTKTTTIKATTAPKKTRTSDAGSDCENMDVDNNGGLEGGDQIKSTRKKNSNLTDNLSQFDSNYQPEKIIGATETNGDLMFLIKWKDMEKADLISSKIARVACPQIVIDFYEERLQWTTGETCRTDD